MLARTGSDVRVAALRACDALLALEAQYQRRVVAWDMSAVSDIGYSALRALMDGEKRMTESGAVLWLTGLNPRVLEVARRAVP